jgi:protein TonB
MARRARLEGSVEVALLIALDGSVEDVQIVRGNPAFDREAVAAVRQWRFRPTVMNGRTVKLLYRVQIDFHLR